MHEAYVQLLQLSASVIKESFINGGKYVEEK